MSEFWFPWNDEYRYSTQYKITLQIVLGEFMIIKKG